MSHAPATPPPKTTCLVNNHNYGRFVRDAVASALAQTVPFDEIIVVDDGSADQSAELLREAFGGHPRIRIIAKPNGGQLSAFNRGFEESAGDIVFFLDADDLYDPAMLENVLEVYRRHPLAGMVFGPVKLFGQFAGFDFARTAAEKNPGRFPDDGSHGALPDTHRREILFGGGREEALRSRTWTGSPTSALSLRRGALERFMPLPASCEPQWRTRADDCLVFGAALLDMPRCYQPLPLTHYRVHGDNAWFSKKAPTPDEERRRDAALMDLFTAVLRQTGGLKPGETVHSLIIGAIWREHGGSFPLGTRFRRGWRAFRRAGLPPETARCEQWRFLKASFRGLLGRRGGAS